MQTYYSPVAGSIHGRGAFFRIKRSQHTKGAKGAMQSLKLIQLGAQFAPALFNTLSYFYSSLKFDSNYDSAAKTPQNP